MFFQSCWGFLGVFWECVHVQSGSPGFELGLDTGHISLALFGQKWHILSYVPNEGSEKLLEIAKHILNYTI